MTKSPSQAMPWCSKTQSCICFTHDGVRIHNLHTYSVLTYTQRLHDCFTNHVDWCKCSYNSLLWRYGSFCISWWNLVGLSPTQPKEWVKIGLGQAGAENVNRINFRLSRLMFQPRRPNQNLNLILKYIYIYNL